MNLEPSCIYSIILIIFLYAFIFLAKIFIRSVLAKKFISWKNATLATKNDELKIQIAFYKVIYYVSAIILGICVLYNESWVYKLNILESDIKNIPIKFKIYYFYEICFYLNELTTIMYEPKKKDFYQMVLHHISTLALMFLSYFNPKFIVFGVVILILHDISDPLLEFAKVENYLGESLFSDVAFFVFVSVFIISRLLIYPRYILYQAFLRVQRENFTLISKVILIFLFTLQVMHIIWTGYIIKLLGKIISGKELSDPRDTVEKPKRKAAEKSLQRSTVSFNKKKVNKASNSTLSSVAESKKNK